jgi:uncharacterized damage-inducible protein DinB
MNKELEALIRTLNSVNEGNPWYGRSVYEMLEEIDAGIVYKKPGKDAHTLIELLYHMITWADFTLKRIEKDKEYDLEQSEKVDWREIDPNAHTWKKGLAEFKSIHKKIIQLLEKKNDDFLKEKVDFREYNFRFLLNGLIQHNIYHIAQVVYVKKLLG